jgi:hypothetical protein
MLTDAQNQELEDLIANGTIRREEEEFYAQTIRERDRGLFRKNDQDKADDEGLSLDAYRKKYGIVAEPEPPTPEPPTPVTPRTPVNNPREPTYEELKIMYSYNYERIYQKRLEIGETPEEADEFTEATLRITYGNDPRPLPTTTTPTTTTPTTPVTPDREPTYEELQVMYPARYQQYNTDNSARYGLTPISPEERAMATEGLLRAEHANRIKAGTAPPLPAPSTATTTTPSTATTTPTPPTGAAQGIEVQDTGPATGFGQGYSSTQTPPI